MLANIPEPGGKGKGDTQKISNTFPLHPPVPRSTNLDYQAISSISPFTTKVQLPSTDKSPQQELSPAPPENNRLRTFRRAGNVCEIIAGSCLNSAVIFTFHLLQIHPIGFVLALGVAHLYFTATAVGESGRRVANVMTGASASISLLCACSEPLSEYWEAWQSKNSAQLEIQQMYQSNSNNDSNNHSDMVSWGGIGLLAVILILFIFHGRR